jgi:TatD DNase family protein
MLRRAHRAGVADVVTLGIDLPSSREAVRLATESARRAAEDPLREAPRIHAAVGIHPSDALKWDQESEPALRDLARSGTVVAIGEIGLDYYRDHAPRDRQRAVFAKSLELARELNLPVVVHIREAHADTLDILKEFAAGGSLRAVLHCFSGGVAEVERAAALGCYLGFGGPLTYKKPPFDAVRAAPRDRLLLETDAPYLAPAPHRGKRNESSYLPLSAAALAGALALPISEVAGLTTANARRLFALGDR